MPVVQIKDAREYEVLIKSPTSTIVLFSADWAEQCKQVEEALNDLSKLLSQNLEFLKVPAEEYPEIAVKHQIEAVPTVIFFTNGTAVDRVDGVDIGAITTICKKLSAHSSDSSQPLEERLKALINTAPLMIFMKGDRTAPRCGFSKTLIGILNETGLPYETFDILSDEEVRQGLKTYSDWPTYPQVYAKGELVGGLDIIKELLANGELEGALKG